MTRVDTKFEQGL